MEVFPTISTKAYKRPSCWKFSSQAVNSWNKHLDPLLIDVWTFKASEAQTFFCKGSRQSSSPLKSIRVTSVVVVSLTTCNDKTPPNLFHINVKMCPCLASSSRLQLFYNSPWHHGKRCHMTFFATLQITKSPCGSMKMLPNPQYKVHLDLHRWDI